MKDWLVQYWLEVGFGLLVSGLGFGVRWIAKKLIAEYHALKQELVETMSEGLSAQKSELIDLLDTRLKEQEQKLLKADAVIQTDMETMRSNVNTLQMGMRSIHTKSFKRECRKLLEVGHVITQAEQEDIDNEFEIYVKLGGDPKDPLYNHVKSKYESGLTNQG